MRPSEPRVPKPNGSACGYRKDCASCRLEPGICVEGPRDAKCGHGRIARALYARRQEEARDEDAAGR